MMAVRYIAMRFFEGLRSSMWTWLPRALVGKIFGFLDIYEVARTCFLVCRGFKVRAYVESVWLLREFRYKIGDPSTRASGLLASLEPAHVKSLAVISEFADSHLLQRLTGLRYLSLVGYGVASRCQKCLLAFWPQLESLRLRAVTLDQKDVALCASLTDLRKLTLLECKVSSVDLGCLAACPLEELTITQVSLAKTRISALWTLTCLRELVLNDVKISDSDLQGIGILTKLEVLCLRRQGITDAGVLHLVDMPRLKVLTLKSTRVQGATLGAIRGVHTLDLSDCQKVARDLTLPPGLRELSLAYCDNVCITGLESLRACPELRTLNMVGCPVDVLHMIPSQAPALQSLVLRHAVSTQCFTDLKRQLPNTLIKFIR
jgi:hypothetical protein